MYTETKHIVFTFYHFLPSPTFSSIRGFQMKTHPLPVCCKCYKSISLNAYTTIAKNLWHQFEKICKGCPDEMIISTVSILLSYKPYIKHKDALTSKTPFVFGVSLVKRLDSTSMINGKFAHYVQKLCKDLLIWLDFRESFYLKISNVSASFVSTFDFSRFVINSLMTWSNSSFRTFNSS